MRICEVCKTFYYRSCRKCYLKAYSKKHSPGYYQAHKEKYIKKAVEWNKKNLKRRLEIIKRYRRKYPERKKAYEKLNDAIRYGNLARKLCRECKKKAEAHHPDYSKPLDVIWLCSTHHSKIHNELRGNKKM